MAIRQVKLCQQAHPVTAHMPCWWQLSHSDLAEDAEVSLQRCYIHHLLTLLAQTTVNKLQQKHTFCRCPLFHIQHHWQRWVHSQTALKHPSTRETSPKMTYARHIFINNNKNWMLKIITAEKSMLRTKIQHMKKQQTEIIYTKLNKM